MKITKDTIIDEITKEHPELTEVLFMDYGLHCVGCFGGSIETIGEGLAGHGMSDEDIDKVITELNDAVETRKL